MTLLFSQRDLMATFKKETFLNANLLRFVYPMPPELARQLCKEDALEKPNQTFFNNFSYYLVCIIDPKSASVITWPLFDSKAERVYRTEFANFLSNYYKNGSISPVMSSYFVNPACYKIIRLMFQLSMLAVQVALKNNIRKEKDKKVVYHITEKYKTEDAKSFQNSIDEMTQNLNVKISKYINNKKKMEQVAEILKDRILKNTDVQKKAQIFLNRIIDEFVAKNNYSKEVLAEILLLKDVQTSASILDSWLHFIDEDIASIEKRWNDKTFSLLDISKKCHKSSEELILRHTGQIDKTLYSVEFDSTKDIMIIEDLALQVPSQQMFILKNIIKSDQLYFPNLIKGFVVAVCYIFRNVRVDEEIFQFNELLRIGVEKYKVLCSMLKNNVNQMKADLTKLECTPEKIDQRLASENLLFTIPVPPTLKFSEEIHKPQIIVSNYTPLNPGRRQFNLKKKNSLPILNRASFKSLPTPFLQIPKDDFMRNIMYQSGMCNRFNFDRTTSSISQSMKLNETVTGSATGFTKDQMNRLLSTKKSSTKKRSIHEKQGNMKRGSLFNNSNMSIIVRSHSSPNLYENRNRMLLGKNCKQLSIMAENCNDLFELSGIVALESSKDTPLKENKSETPAFNAVNKEISVIEISENCEEKSFVKVDRNSLESPIENDVTPKLDDHPIRKSNSIEKIINRFKKVRANVCESKLHFKTVKEEKEMATIVSGDIKSKKLLPDLLEQSCSKNIVSEFPDWTLFNLPDEKKKTRESLGSALGVNKSFLDQFELID